MFPRWRFGLVKTTVILMRQTLVEIPYEIGGVPLFGFGLLLALMAVVSVAIVVYLRRHGASWPQVMSQAWMLLLLAGLLFALPKVFPGAGLPVRGYGVMVVLGVACGVALAMHRARQMGVDPDLIFTLAFWLFVGGIVGARAFHVVQKWEQEYARETWRDTIIAVVNIPQGGLVVYGALIGAAIGFLLFTRKYKLPALPLADLIAPSLLLGLALGRVGCLMNGCCYGGQCSLPWAVTFPPGSPPFQRQVERGEILLYGIQWENDPESRPVIRGVTAGSHAATSGLAAGDEIAEIDGEPVRTTSQAQWLIGERMRHRQPVALVMSDFRKFELPVLEWRRSLPVHPTQLYAAIGAGLICLFLVAYYPYRRRDGEVIALALTLYAIVRFLEEAIRTDESGMFGTPLSISQHISIAMLLAVSGLWWHLARRPLGSLLPVRPVA